MWKNSPQGRKKCLTYSDQDGRASSKDRSEAGTFLPSLLRQNRIRNRFRIRNSGFRTRWRPSCLNYFASSSKSPFLTLKMLLSVELKIGEIPFTLNARPSGTKGQGIKNQRLIIALQSLQSKQNCWSKLTHPTRTKGLCRKKLRHCSSLISGLYQLTLPIGTTSSLGLDLIQEKVPIV